MKVFLSYSHRNEDFVIGLYRRLTRDGVSCFFNRESIAWGANWVIELEKGIDECESIILCLSPDFCRSEWTKLERTGAMADDPGGLKRKLRPLLLEPCSDLIPRFLIPIQHIDVSTPTKFEDNYPEICRELGGTVIEESTSADRDKLPSVCRLPDRNWMPHRSLGDVFVGRVRDLWQINDMLRERKTAVVEGVGVVVGTGGIGKTQLAIEYVHRFGASYPGGVFWIDAEQKISNMIVHVVQGADIDIDSKLEERHQLLQLWKTLSQLPPVLIVLDNFPENEPLQPWLPPASSIHTLVTTRRRDLNYSRLSIDFMTAAEGIMLLSRGARKFGHEAAELVDTLGGLPLALELARNFLNIRTDVSIDSLVQEILRVGEMKTLSIFADKYANELPSGHIKEVAATIQISWALASATAQTVLQCMSLLAPKPIPRRLLRKILGLPSETILEDPLDDAISELANKLSLVKLDKENDPEMHRLVAGFVNTTVGENRDLHDKVVNEVEEEMARVTDEKDSQSYNQLEKIIPHAEMLLSSESIETKQAIDIFNYLRWHNSKWGRYRIAEKHGRKSLGLSEASYGPGHPSIATKQSNLALVLQDLGELEEARDLLRLALDSNQESYEPGHPSIAISQSNLALVLKDLGELEEARDLLRLALDSGQKSFEPGHPSIATRQSNLALVLKDLGELEEARDLLRLALDSDQKSYEPGHPSIAISQSNLAMVLRDLGELEEARDLLRLALDSDQKSYEPGHPSIARSQSNLAQVLRDLGELEEARDLLRLALDSDQESYEPGHPSIAISQSNLALVLQDLGELEEARDLLRKALDSAQKSFEPGHPSIAISQSNLALVLQDLGELEEARDLLRLALDSNQKSYEPGHPSIATKQSNLALVLQDLGELEEARDLLRLALDSDQKSYEPGHPSIARSQSNLAQVLQDLGELEEARDLLRVALDSDQKSYEPSHPSIATKQSNLALVLQDLGELEEARDLAQKAYKTFLNKFGPGHPNTIIAKRNWESIASKG